MTRDYNEIIDWMQLINKANTQLLHYRDMTIKANELATIQGMHIDPAHVSNSSNNNGTENKLIRYLEIKEQINKIYQNLGELPSRDINEVNLVKDQKKSVVTRPFGRKKVND